MNYRDLKDILELIILIMLCVFIFIASYERTYAASPVEITVTVPEYQEYFDEIGEEYGISSCLLEAMAYTESRLDASAVSDNGKYFGLMQISKSVWNERKDRLGLTDIFDAKDNITCAADYLMELANTYGTEEDLADISLVLDIYSGHSNAFELFEDGKMSSYSTKVLEMEQLLSIYR